MSEAPLRYSELRAGVMVISIDPAWSCLPRGAKRRVYGDSFFEVKVRGGKISLGNQIGRGNAVLGFALSPIDRQSLDVVMSAIPAQRRRELDGCSGPTIRALARAIAGPFNYVERRFPNLKRKP